MDNQIRTILDLTDKLDKSHRWALVQYLLDRIRNEDESLESELSEAWEKELDRREMLIDSGNTEFYSWAEVKKELKGH